jgi:hypothetical protein
MKSYVIQNISKGTVELRDYKVTLTFGESYTSFKAPQTDTKLLAGAKTVKIKTQGKDDMPVTVKSKS